MPRHRPSAIAFTLAAAMLTMPLAAATTTPAAIKSIDALASAVPIPLTDDIWMTAIRSQGKIVIIDYNFPTISGAGLNHLAGREKDWLRSSLEKITINNVCAARTGVYSLVHAGYDIHIRYSGVSTFVMEFAVSAAQCRGK